MMCGIGILAIVSDSEKVKQNVVSIKLKALSIKYKSPSLM